MRRVDERKTLIELIVGGGRQAAAAFVGLLIYPLIARVLSAELLGAWALVSTAGFLLGLADLGLTTAVHRAAVTPDRERARRTVAFALFIILAVTPFFIAVSYFFLIDAPNLEAMIGPSARGAIAAVFAGGVTLTIASPYRGFLIARGGVGKVAAARAVGAAVQLVVTIAAISVERSLRAPALGFLVGAFADLALTLRAASAMDPQILARPRLPKDRRELIADAHNGAAALVINIAVTVALRVDVFVLSRVAPLAAVAAYGVAGRAVDVSYVLAKQSTVALMPRLGDPEKREAAVRVGIGVFGGVVAAGMIALALVGQPLLVAWVGPLAAGPLTDQTLKLLAIGAVLQAAIDVPASMLTLGGRTAWAAALPIAVGGAANIAVSVLGAPHYGALAIAGSTVVGNTITALLVWASARRMLAWGRIAVARAFLPPLAAGISAALVAWLLASFAARGLLQSLAACAASLAAAGAVLAAACANVILPAKTIESVKNTIIVNAQVIYPRAKREPRSPRG